MMKRWNNNKQQEYNVEQLWYYFITSQLFHKLYRHECFTRKYTTRKIHTN